jgi:hypothetical protein
VRENPPACALLPSANKTELLLGFNPKLVERSLNSPALPNVSEVISISILLPEVVIEIAVVLEVRYAVSVGIFSLVISPVICVGVAETGSRQAIHGLIADSIVALVCAIMAIVALALIMADQMWAKLPPDRPAVDR